MSEPFADKPSDKFDCCEQLEILVYEALAVRRAVLTRMREMAGPDLEIEANSEWEWVEDFIELHNLLFDKTQRASVLLRDLSEAETRLRNPL